jgi:hypothetical protein
MADALMANDKRLQIFRRVPVTSEIISQGSGSFRKPTVRKSKRISKFKEGSKSYNDKSLASGHGL